MKKLICLLLLPASLALASPDIPGDWQKTPQVKSSPFKESWLDVSSVEQVDELRTGLFYHTLDKSFSPKFDSVARYTLYNCESGLYGVVRIILFKDDKVVFNDRVKPSAAVVSPGSVEEAELKQVCDKQTKINPPNITKDLMKGKYSV